MKLKDYKPKYDSVDVLVRGEDELGYRYELFNLRYSIIENIKYKDAIQYFGEREVLGVKDYDIFKNTSIVVSEEVTK